MYVDCSAYEGIEVTGRTETVLLRGEVILDHGEFVGHPGAGRFLARGPNLLA
jgi:dihydropyrimidinase